MSAVDPVAEPSMEEILSSIRDAINDEAPAGSALPSINGDPFGAGSSAEAAFSSPPPGQNFDSSTHRSHDPFSELTRKLNETRESVHQQMQQASTPTKPSEAPARAPAAQAEPTVASTFGSKPEEQVPDQRAEFSAIVSNLARREPAASIPPPAPAPAPPPVQPAARAPVQPQVPQPDPVIASNAPDSSTSPSDAAMLDAMLRRVVEPAVKAWLDENLSRIVTDVVREEVRRVASQLK